MSNTTPTPLNLQDLIPGASCPEPRLHLEIDGQECYVTAGTTILDAAKQVGIDIPTLCYLRGVNNIGSCRVCSVEIEGRSELAPACNTPAEDGMVIHTDTDRVLEFRRTMLDLIISKHGLNSTNYCFSCVKNGACELQKVCRDNDVTEPTFPVRQERKPLVDANPFLTYDPNLCIECQRCVAACNNQACNHTLQPGKTGVRTTILAPFGPDWKTSGCESCGCCAAACPTGALTEKRRKDYREWEVTKVLTTCPHCATGCQYYLKVKDGKIVDTEPYPGASNDWRLCVKGRSASFDFVQADDRLTTPLVKNVQTGAFEPTSWDDALDLVASKFTELKQQFGPDSLAVFACARSANEDIYMAQKMARCAFGTNNVDNCARVCHAPSVAGLARTLGSGAMTNTIKDITDNPDVIMLVGSNPEEAHPVIGMQIRRAVEHGTKLIVVDPRDINLAKEADIHLKLRPGTNVAFANGIVHILIEENMVDWDYVRNQTEGFDDLARMVKPYTPERVAEICHIDARDLIAAARLYGHADRAPIIYCLGVTEHSTGTEGVMSLSNIAVVNGKIGRPGCGINPIRGQNNVQGACDMGAQPNQFSGYQNVENDEIRHKFEKAWGVTIPPKNGMTSTDVMPAAIEGKIKGLFIFGEDPIRTDPDIHHVIKALNSLDFLVVDDLFMTETAKYADVVLPGASYAEKEGTFSNTERRVQRIRKAVDSPGDARLDTWIFTQIMNRMGYPQPPVTAADVMDEIASLTPSFAGISHERLDRPELIGKGLQWPCKGPDHPGTPIMHVGHASKGKATYSTADYRASNELPDADYPLIMMTGRVLYQYNAGAMTERTEGTQEMGHESFIEINTIDADRQGIADGDRVKVSSRRGEIETTARVSGKTNPGETWMPFSFQDGNSNWLTNAALDNICRAPEYKVCAVKVERAS